MSESQSLRRYGNFKVAKPVLTTYTEQSPSEASSHSASQEVSRVLWNPNIY